MKNDPVLASKKGIRDIGWLQVEGGLHYIKGNSSPYFSLTCSYQDGGGAAHDLILKHFPQFADLAALHLSDINGAPMYALENGFYHMGGTSLFGSASWDHAASHFRISVEQVKQLARDLFGDWYSENGGFLVPGEAVKAKARLASWVDQQRPRWKAEAEACISKHGLVIYGDHWVSGL